MFPFLAFKGLHWNRNLLILFSPVIRVPWSKKMTPWGEFFYCEAAANDLEYDKGIFAASIGEARSYTIQVHLVAPDPRHRIVLGTSGWRAEAAMVVDFMTTDKHAARQIISAYYAGYPQVSGILAWAARYAPPEEGVRVLQDILRDWQDEKVLQVIADSAAAIGEHGVPILEELSRSDNASVQLKVLNACCRPIEYLRPILQNFAESEYESVRTYAAFACGTHGVGALPLLERLARDESCDVRVAVAKSAWRLGKVAIPILEELQHDKSKYVQLVASNLLRAVKKSAKRENGGGLNVLLLSI